MTFEEFRSIEESLGFLVVKSFCKDCKRWWTASIRNQEQVIVVSLQLGANIKCPECFSELVEWKRGDNTTTIKFDKTNYLEEPYYYLMGTSLTLVDPSEKKFITKITTKLNSTD